MKSINDNGLLSDKPVPAGATSPEPPAIHVLEMVKDARDKGYETTLNLMAVTTLFESELDEALPLLAVSEADAVYVVDSFGALYMTETRRLVEKYFAALSAAGTFYEASNSGVEAQLANTASLAHPLRRSIRRREVPSGGVAAS